MRDGFSLVLASLHLIPIKFQITLNDQAPRNLQDLIKHYAPIKTPRSQNASLLVVPTKFKSRFGGRAFCCQAPLLWDQLPVSVQSLEQNHQY